MGRFALCFLIALISFLPNSSAQSSFPSDPNAFANELIKYLKNSRSTRCQDASALFKKTVENGQFDENMLAAMVAPANNMLSRRMGPANYMAPFANSAVALAQGNQSGQRFYDWAEITTQLTQGRSPSDDKLKKWLEFSEVFFFDQTIYSSKSKSWAVEPEDYKIQVVDGVAEVFFPLTELYGMTTGDTISIIKTRGTYLPTQAKWKGVQGKIRWDRTPLNPNDVYADFRAYEIDFRSTEFVIDSAVLTYNPVLSKPLLGKLSDKLVQNNTPQKTTYPRFISYDKNVSDLELYPNVKYRGAFALRGGRFQGSGGEGNSRAELQFFDAEDRLAIRAYSDQFVVDEKDRIYADRAQVSVFFSEDSIYHPSIDLRFDQTNGELILSRQKKGTNSAPFVSSYHMIEANPDRLIWNINDTAIYMAPRISAVRPEAYFSSLNLYEERLFNRIHGVTSYHPLVVMKRYADQTGRREFDALEIAQQFNRALSVDGAASIFYEMMTEGFIYYDKSTETVIMQDKTENYVLSNAEQIDYDIIKMESKPPSEGNQTGINGQIDVRDGNMILNDVFTVNLSDSQFVRIFPKGKKLTVGANRDLYFGGTIFGGGADFYGEDFHFSYDSFAVYMNSIDSMVMFVPTGELDAEGEPITEAVKTSISGLSGTLYIDQPFNKSGLQAFDMFPWFKANSTAIADYEKPGVFDSAYRKEEFYFEVDEFEVDSMDGFEVAAIGFGGTLKSGGIFPDLKDRITVQDDLSLGFQTSTPESGLDLYGDKAQYTGDISLSNKGLRGTGKIDYLTTIMQGQQVVFFPDSAKGPISSVIVGKQSGQVQFPDVKNENVAMLWKPKADSLTLKMREQPFRFFEGQTELKGNITVTPKELRGEGLMFWPEGSANSNDFQFGAEWMRADSAQVKINSAEKDREALVLNDAFAEIDFEKQKGIFRSNNVEAFTELPFNRYMTTVNNFEWDMEAQKVDFRTSGRSKSTFQSTQKGQDSLRFLAESGEYDLSDHVLNLRGIDYIAVGDAHVIPPNGQVVIERDAAMRSLEGAKVFMDSLNVWHELENADVSIQGKYIMSGEADYRYLNRLGIEQIIHFNQLGAKRGLNDLGDSAWITYAKGVIPDTQNFYLDPKVQFKGPVGIESNSDRVAFRGFAKLNFADTTLFRTGWFAMNDAIESDNFLINIDTAITDGKDSAYVGLFRLFGDRLIYPVILNRKRRSKDKPVIRVRGFVQYNEDLGQFIFGDPDKADEFSYRGSLMRVNENTGHIYADGELDMGVDFDLLKYRAAATSRHKPSDTAWTFNTTFVIKLLLTDDLKEAMGQDFFEMNLDADWLDYYDTEKLDFLTTLPQVVDLKTEERLMENIETLGEFQKVKGYEYDLGLTDMKLIWDENSETWRTYNEKAGILHLGPTSMNQTVKVVAEFAPRASGDYFTIYLETDIEEWYYFAYKKNVLKVVSSNEDFNQLVRDTDPKKLTWKHPGTQDQFSATTIGSVAERNRFLAKMGYFD
jgi:hypothetical protein